MQYSFLKVQLLEYVRSKDTQERIIMILNTKKKYHNRNNLDKFIQYFYNIFV